jgi:hypothetical protein
MPVCFHFLGGAGRAFPRSRHFQSCDRDQRSQGCAAPAGLDLDTSARRGRTMVGTYCVVEVAALVVASVGGEVGRVELGYASGSIFDKSWRPSDALFRILLSTQFPILET